MKTYSLGTFSINNGQRFAGLVIDGEVTPLTELVHTLVDVDILPFTSVLAMLERWEECLPVVNSVIERIPKSSQWYAMNSLNVHPPVDLPRQIFCTGANYRKHVVDLTVDSGVGPEGLNKLELKQWAENMMDERVAHGEPYAFSKPVSSIAGAFDALVLPDNTEKPDWELELAVVIGKGGTNIRRADALLHVAGYAIVNDISARDLIPRTDYKMLGTDWLRSKGQPGFLPFGPILVPSQFVPEPHQLAIRLSVSGQVMQDETTADMLFGIERQIEYISQYCRLLPGDLICTGSPAGNGTHYNRFLRAGDVMEAEISGLGSQRVVCVAA